MNAFILENMKILVPKNSGLKEYSEQALNLLKTQKKKTLQVRGEDVALLLERFLRNGKNAIGMTGEDLFREYVYSRKTPMLKIIKRIEWNDPEALFGKPTICLLGPRGSNLKDLPKNLTVAINSKYKMTAKRALNLIEKTSGFNFKKIYTKGMSELLFSEGITDLVIDIVYTGSSMREYGLVIYEKIFSSDFVILGGKND